MLQRSSSVFGIDYLPKICTPSCTARCMAVYLVHSMGENVTEVIRKRDVKLHKISRTFKKLLSKHAETISFYPSHICSY